LVALLVVLAMAYSNRKTSIDARGGSYVEYPARRWNAQRLEESLVDAVRRNPYRLSPGENPSVQLAEVVKVRPQDYNSAVEEVLHRFREGAVVSVDLATMEAEGASRLVDFCSGMAAVSHGWVFRVTDHVIILNPPE
jgi:FtsZ-interacting cell division protein YlmF